MFSTDPDTLFYTAVTLFFFLCTIVLIKGFDLLADTKDTVQCLSEAAGLLQEINSKLEEIQELADTIDASREDGKLTPEELKLIGQQLREVADPDTIKRIKGVIKWAALRMQQC